MNWQEIEHLLEKYYEGETSLEEEQQIRDFFAGGRVPPHLASLRPQFLFREEEIKAGISDSDFDRKVMGAIREKGISRVLNLRNPWFYWVSGVAATALILLAVFVQFNPFGKNSPGMDADTDLAYTEARRVLLFVSDKLNQGTEKLQPVGKFSDGLDNLNTISNFSEGMDKASSLGKINDVVNIN